MQIIIRVTEEERALIEEKMQQIPTLNLSAYARKILIDGYIITLDLQEVKGHTAQLQKIGVNINQIAKRINETGRIYADDMDEIKRAMEEVWRLERRLLLQFKSLMKSVCNNQISLLLQNVFVWLLMWSGVSFAQSHQPNKSVVDFNVLMSLTVYNGPFSNFNVVNQFLNDLPVQFLQVQVLPDSPGPLSNVGDVLPGFPLPG